jgi:hypothetical protein
MFTGAPAGAGFSSRHLWSAGVVRLAECFGENAMRVVAQMLRIVTLLLGVVELIWIARYLLADFGILGVLVAWFVFPLTLLLAPWYGLLGHQDWLGVAFFVLGPVTFVALRVLGTKRIGDF